MRSPAHWASVSLWPGFVPSSAPALWLPDQTACSAGRTTIHSLRNLQQGYAFYRSLGTKAMALRGVTGTPVDEGHLLARVEYRATYEKADGERIEIDFAVSYCLAARGESFEIFAFVAGDEMALYRKHELVPDSS